MSKNGRDNQPNLSVVSRDSVKTEDRSEQAAFIRIENISDDDFFSYYVTLADVIIPQLSLISGLILGVLFHQSYGSRRNWCQISLSDLERRLGASRNTIRKHLKPLIEDGWVCILSESHREATTYGLRIPLEADEE
ncbi:MAG: helix-turn-helix domain-containing protein [Gemmatimonadota bacterium]|nr:helix-turn-helix domain-containing protein [Gemmatimonadota bacterium]